MKSINIKLDSIEKVKKFVHIVASIESDLDLVSSRYTIDAKSIMGIFSLDLSKELKLVVANGNDVTFAEVKEKLSEFIV